MRNLFYSLGLKAIRLSRFDKMLRAHTRGLGVILMLHHVRPYVDKDFAPNNLLEITPTFLDEALSLVRDRGFEIIGLDDVPERLKNPQPNRPFVAITLDDGYKDLTLHALPVFKKHQAPFTAYITTGFADAVAPLLWLNLEQAIQALDMINLNIDGKKFEYNTQNARKKTATYYTLYWRLRKETEACMRKVIAALVLQAGLDPLNETRELCLDWEGVRQLSQEPLATIGAHTLTHPMLAKHGADLAQSEIKTSRAIIERELNIKINHFAYPVGDKTSASTRDYALTKEAGFATAVTTRKGMLFAEHANHLHALPRLSMNGLFQNTKDLDTLLSGVPFALLNRGQKLDVN